MLRAPVKHTVNPWLQITLMVITSVILTVTIYYNLHMFDAREFMPRILQLSSEEKGRFASTAANVETGIYFYEFSEFDMIRGKFTVDLTLWFRYTPSEISLEQLEKFYFEKAEVKSRSPARTRKKGDKVITEYDMRISFAFPLSFKFFPLDDHRLDFTLINYDLSPAQINVITSNKNIITSPEIHFEGWTVFKKQAQTGYIEHAVDIAQSNEEKVMHPRIVFSIDFERAGVRQIASIFVPLIIIFFVTLFSFSIDPADSDFYNVIAMSSTSIFALIAYRFVIETISPPTGYFTLSDYMFIFFLLATSVILFINTLGRSISGRVRSIATMVLHLLTILLFVYLFIGQ